MRADLFERFTDATLPQVEWNHRAHLQVALEHLHRFPEEEALGRMRAGILRLNAAHGVETTPTSGYHETLTVFWMRELAGFLREGLPDEEALARYDKAWPLRHYRRETLMSPEARTGWVPPDLA